jgi:hypothetical protein
MPLFPNKARTPLGVRQCDAKQTHREAVQMNNAAR